MHVGAYWNVPARAGTSLRGNWVVTSREAPNPDAFWSHPSAFHYPDENQDEMARHALLCAWSEPPDRTSPPLLGSCAYWHPSIKQGSKSTWARQQEPKPELVATSVLGDGEARRSRTTVLSLGHHLTSAA